MITVPYPPEGPFRGAKLRWTWPTICLGFRSSQPSVEVARSGSDRLHEPARSGMTLFTSSRNGVLHPADSSGPSRKGG